MANELTIHNSKNYVTSYGVDWEDDKEFIKYVKFIERKVRGSLEYKEYLDFLHETIDMNRCSYFGNVTREIRHVKIEIHHHPLTLFDIVTILTKHRLIGCEEPFTVYDICNDVMECHYKNLVGLIPLSETVHELVHNQQILIPTDKVFGNWEEFVEMYKGVFTKELLEKMANMKKFSNHQFQEVPDLLEINPQTLKLL